MNTTSLQEHYTGLSRLKLYLALSRTPHGLLDMATPAFGALVWMGTFPPANIIILGLITAFAGYTAVYALNDLIDRHVDEKKIRLGQFTVPGADLDALLVRHPIARGLLSFRQGLLWTAAWAFLALLGAYKLNPVCVLIFVMGCVLEGVYCLLLRISHLRAFVSGAVKTSGALAAVYAVDPNPSPPFLLVLFLLFFFWEVGGQNVPNDWSDIKGDTRIHGKTMPIKFGQGGAAGIILGSLSLALVLSLVLLLLAPIGFGLPWLALSLFVGLCFLIIPGVQLYRKQSAEGAIALFNRASCYPLALLILVIVKIVI